MSFLLDTDICSAYLRADRHVGARFLQYSGGLYVSAVTLAELYAGAARKNQSPKLAHGIQPMLGELQVLPVNEVIAEVCGRERGQLLDAGTPIGVPDLLIAATALVHNFTMVTHNLRHFSKVPALRIVDWLAS